MITLNEAEKNEKALLLRLRNGDGKAFECIYRIYSLPIYGNILKMVHDEDAADDLLQDVFLKIWDKREDIDPEKSFRSFLFTCSKHLVYNFIRRGNLENQVANYLSYRNTELYSHIEEDIAYKQTETFFRDVVAKLPAQRQKIYNLCKVEGRSYEEAATLLGLSTSTIHGQLVKATHFIKEQMTHAEPAIIAGLFLCLFHKV